MITRRSGFALVLLAALTAGGAVFLRSVLPGAPPDHPDEAGHAVWGLLVAYDLRTADGANLAFDLYRQVYWPPLHALVLGLVHLVCGPGIVPARGVSAAAYVLTALLLYLAGTRLRPDRPQVAGAAAAAAFLSSPALAHFAGWCMLELPGVACVQLVLLTWIALARRDAPPRRYVFLGLGLAAAYFTKSNYGVLLALAVGLEFLVAARGRPALLREPRVGYTALPLLLLLAVWFAYPPKIVSTWRMLTNQPWGVQDAFSLEGLLYFPRAFGRLAGSPVMLGVYLAALLWGIRRGRDPAVRLLLWVILLQFAVGELHHTKLDRHLFPLLPAVFLLVGHGAASAWGRLARYPGLRLAAGAALLAHGAVLFRAGLRPPPAHPPSEAVVRYVTAQLRRESPALLLATKDLTRPSLSVLDWYLIVRDRLFPPPRAGTVTPAAEVAKLQRLWERLGRPALLAPLLAPIRRRAGERGPVQTLYVGTYPYGFLHPEELAAFWPGFLRRSGSRRVVLVTARHPGPRHPFAFFAPIFAAAGLEHLARRRFRDPAVQVDVFRVPRGP